jgi:FtsP/CotA-like multicopper oxidase with cupredoxin domain
MRLRTYILPTLVVALVVMAVPVGAQFDPAFDPPLAVDTNPDLNIFETSLTAAPLTWEFIPGVFTSAMAYNGSIPGPLIDANVGDTLIVHFTNNLGEDTTIHWHGIDAPIDMDGSHISQHWVPDGGTFDYEFELLTPGLKFYHPHIRTDVQVEHGLYGAVLVRDPVNDALLGIEGEEHVIIFDDILLDDGTGEFATFDPQDPLERAIYFLSGRRGNHLIVNGKEGVSLPPLQIPNGEPQRWWVLNASNTVFSRLDLHEYYATNPANPGDPVQNPNEKWTGPLYQIGGDRGFLSARQWRQAVVEVVPPAPDSGGPDHFIFEDFRGILLTPGERGEYVFTPYGRHSDTLRVDQWDWARGDHVAFYMPDLVTIGLGDDPLDGFRAVQTFFNMVLVGPDVGPPRYAPPPTLVPLAEVLDPLEADKTIQITLGHMPPMPNGDVTFFAQKYLGMPKPMPAISSLEAYDLDVGDIVHWEITNLTHGDHPFHTHGFAFQWYEVEYIDAETPENNYKEFPTDNGGVIQNKDTVLVPARPGNFGLSSTVMRAMMKIDDTGREGRITGSGGKASDTSQGGWLYHCHILEHAIGGMMSFYEVRDPIDPYYDIGGGSGSPGAMDQYLSGSGTVLAGQPMSLDLSEGTPGASTYLVAGITEIYVPKAGALWVPSPDAIFGPFTIDGSGNSSLGGVWPGLPLGATVAVQYWTDEGGSVLTASNGLRITQL